MTQLSQQMQGKMTLVLNELRGKTIARMTEAGERIKKRPALKGDDSFKKVQSHQVMQKNDDGAMILSAAIGVPGLSETADAALDVAEQLYGDRKATHERPQDKMEFTPKQEAKIRDENAQDLAQFQDLDNKLNTLNTYISQGYTFGLDWNGELIPWEQIEDPKHTMKMNPVEEMKLRAEGLDFAPAMMKPRSSLMKMGA